MKVNQVQPVKLSNWDVNHAALPHGEQARKAASEVVRPIDRMDNSVQEKVREAIQALNESALLVGRDLEFVIHEDTGRTMVRVIDRETKELIREIPPEKILDLIARINEMIGLLLDERA